MTTLLSSIEKIINSQKSFKDQRSKSNKEYFQLPTSPIAPNRYVSNILDERKMTELQKNND
jgi:hypothetical protein